MAGHPFSLRTIKAYMDRVTAPQLEALGLSPAGAQFLSEISRNEGISLKEISENLLVDKAHTTRMVNKLTEQGLIENTASGHQYSLRLTEKGVEVHAQVSTIMHSAWRDVYSGLTPEETEALRSILGKITENIRRTEGKD